MVLGGRLLDSAFAVTLILEVFVIVKVCFSELAVRAAIVGDGGGELIFWAICCFEIIGEAGGESRLDVVFDSFAAAVEPENWEDVLRDDFEGVMIP